MSEHGRSSSEVEHVDPEEVLTADEEAVVAHSRAVPEGSDADLWAFAFDSSLRAQEALLAAMRLVARKQLALEDAAVVAKVRGKVRITQTKDVSPSQGAVGGAWIGILAGLLLGPGGPLVGGALGAAAGFETRCLFTADVYDDGIDPGTAELLVDRGDTLSLRGETIFYLGRKTGETTGAPERFYHGDPVRMSGELRLEKTETDTGLAQLVAVNTSTAWWPVEGQGATCFLAQWIDATGTLVHQVVLELLTEPVAPGAEQAIRLRLDPDHAGRSDGHLKLHLFQADVGPFSGTGRAAPLTMPCSERAFLRLAARAYG